MTNLLIKLLWYQMASPTTGDPKKDLKTMKYSVDWTEISIPSSIHLCCDFRINFISLEANKISLSIYNKGSEEEFVLWNTRCQCKTLKENEDSDNHYNKKGNISFITDLPTSPQWVYNLYKKIIKWSFNFEMLYQIKENIAF